MLWDDKFTAYFDTWNDMDKQLHMQFITHHFTVDPYSIQFNLCATAGASLHEILLWHKRNDSDPAHIWLRDLLVRLTQEM